MRENAGVDLELDVELLGVPITMARLIYEGSIEVDSTAYLQYPRDDEELDEDEADELVPIPDLDEAVSTAAVLKFELDYPFERSFAGEVRGESSITLRAIIDAVRAGYREMYAGSAEHDIPNLVNKRVEGGYGTAFHEMSDLVIEGIEIDDATGTLEVFIGS